MGAEVVEVGRRKRELPPPPWVVWESLANPRRPQARPWLVLLDDEREPRILGTEKNKLVVWSSLWPSTPAVLIHFELASKGSAGTSLTWTLTSPHKVSDRAVEHQRERLNQLVWADLRFSYGE